MKLIKILKYKQLASASREARLSELIRRYVAGKLSDYELENELERLYNRPGAQRTSPMPSAPPSVLGADPLYQNVLHLITSTYPRKQDLRPDQIESYANTTSARAASAERLSEYAGRGVQMVKVVAYLDEVTTDICRMMHGRIFELGPAAQIQDGQGPLVHPASFWQGNENFSQTPTPDMEPWLPPYHYNCRTRIIPYIEPAEPYDAAMDRYNNLLKFREQDIQSLISQAASLQYASPKLLQDHFEKHGDRLNLSSQSEYKALLKKLLKNPLKQMGLAVSARDRSLNLYLWDPNVRTVNNKAMHDFAVFSLDKKCLKTLHPKPMDLIMQNLDPKVHGKVMMLTDQFTAKGAKMIVEYEVKCYEYILDYFAEDDSTDEQEMFARLGMEKEWDTIPKAFKQRILAVDKTVLEKYADRFDYNVFNTYIKTIKRRQELENNQEES